MRTAFYSSHQKGAGAADAVAVQPQPDRRVEAPRTWENARFLVNSPTLRQFWALSVGQSGRLLGLVKTHAGFVRANMSRINHFLCTRTGGTMCVRVDMIAVNWGAAGEEVGIRKPTNTTTIYILAFAHGHRHGGTHINIHCVWGFQEAGCGG